MSVVNRQERDRLIGLCVDRGGYRLGARVAEFVMEWELAVREHGRPIGTEEFAAWWRQSRATVYRRLAEFRQLFPELGPHAIPGERVVFECSRCGRELDDESLGLECCVACGEPS